MRRFAISSLIGLAALAGCDRREPAPETPSAADSTAPATAPTTAPAVVAPTSSFITIGDRMIQFPPASIRIREDDDGRIALLYSGKPAKITDESAANSYYLQMVLDIPEGGDIGAASWRYKAPSSEAADSPNGIFLDKARVHLQPFDVAVDFEDQPPFVVVVITGQFLEVVESRGDVPGDFVPVSARLIAKVDSGNK
jgi:hypothetical protein